MKSALIGSVAFSRNALGHLVEMEYPPVLVVTRASSTYHADYADLATPAREAGIDVHHTTDVNSEETLEYIRMHEPDVLFCFGWSQLLSPSLLGIAPLGVVGYHPAMLPRNRGRHPLIWALVLGLKKTGSTFFYMDEGADSGDILSQETIEIGPDDDAARLYQKMTRTALRQISDFVPRLANHTADRIVQNHAQSSYWRKRSKADGRIDWRMPSDGIHNLVRALARPYPGATVRRGDTDQIVWRTDLSSTAGPSDCEPGKVLSVVPGGITVKTGDGTIRLVEHELDPLPQAGDYL